MKKEDIDQLYHLLRLVAVDTDETLRRAIDQLSSYMCRGEPPKNMADYLELIDYLDWYGKTHLIDKVAKGCRTFLKMDNYSRIVDLGAGLGWLGLGLSTAFTKGWLPIDKRKWTVFIEKLDLERNMGLLLKGLKDDDLLVMSEFLHCLEDPKAILGQLTNWDWVIIEYDAGEKWEYAESYVEQIDKFGASSVGFGHISGILSTIRQELKDTGLRRTNNYLPIFPYTMVVSKIVRG